MRINERADLKVFKVTSTDVLAVLRFALLCFTDTAVLQTEGLWPPCVEHVCWCPFSNSVCSPRVSVSHFGNSHNIFKPSISKKITVHWRLRGWLAFFSKKVFFFLFIYFLFTAVLGFRFCARAFSSCGKRGPLFIAVRRPLSVAASLVAEHRLQTRKLSNCGSWAQLLRGMWDLPRPGLEPVSQALAGRFSTTAPPGKPSKKVFLS